MNLHFSPRPWSGMTILTIPKVCEDEKFEFHTAYYLTPPGLSLLDAMLCLHVWPTAHKEIRNPLTLYLIFCSSHLRATRNCNRHLRKVTRRGRDNDLVGTVDVVVSEVRGERGS